ncbi:class I SAM-dependent methyltransferase [Candidatus Woesearchaeota archaeon]|nr:class I SAM-dependent methyltransferase [Candidatus Woesearchaeota archaeon]
MNSISSIAKPQPSYLLNTRLREGVIYKCNEDSEPNVKNSKELFEQIYEKPEEAGWAFTYPPQELIELVEMGKVAPCKALEVGCGEGRSSLFLASKGFTMTGIDWSEKAVWRAKQHSQDAGIRCRFVTMNFKDLPKLNEKFDFIFDWRFFHDITEQEEREAYVEIVHRHLKENGKYLSVSFAGNGERIKSPRNVWVYFASIEEMEQLFCSHFRIIEKKMINITRMRGGERPATYFFMEKLSF